MAYARFFNAVTDSKLPKVLRSFDFTMQTQQGVEFVCGRNSSRVLENGWTTGMIRVAGFNDMQLFVGHPSGGDDSPSTITPAFESGCKEPCGTIADVRILCKEGRLKEAVHNLDVMDQQGIKANLDTYACLLQGCIRMKALAEGKCVHAHILKSRIKPNIFLGNTLVNMYFRCNSVVDARHVFDTMHERNVFTWAIMIAGYTQHGRGEEALELFWKIKREGVKPDRVIFLSILKACATIAALDQGKQIHAEIIKSGFELDISVGNTLIDMYAKCGSIEHARQVFDEMPIRDVVSWTAMIAGYAQHRLAEEALQLFRRMDKAGVQPNVVTFVSILKACTSVTELKQGKQIHGHIIKSGLESDVFVGSTLVNMYAKCGSLKQARQVFDKMPQRNLVSWNAMISGYVQHGQCEEAFELFQQLEWEGVKPNEVTYVSILKACASMSALEWGKKIHAHIIKSQVDCNVFVGSTLVDMYARCRSIEHAREVFDEMPKRNVVSWNAMIAGYVQHGHAEEALKLFRQIELEGVKPDEVTFVSILKACANVAALEQGKLIHADIIKSGFEADLTVASTLVDMYAKCGSIEHARCVFDEMPERKVVTWNAMIAGYAQHGRGKEALQLVEQMQQEGIKLDHITFLSIFSACSHAGLVDEGVNYFNSMIQDHGITPTPEHYACMVDLLGRMGHLEEAEEFIKKMPLQPNAAVWTALLGACRIYGNVKLAKHVTERILELEPQNDAAFVMLSNVYAAAGRWGDKAKERKVMEDSV